jgi:hypothetical protein
MTICNGGIRLVELEILMVMLGQKDNGKSKVCMPRNIYLEHLLRNHIQEAFHHRLFEFQDSYSFLSWRVANRTLINRTCSFVLTGDVMGDIVLTNPRIALYKLLS